MPFSFFSECRRCNRQFVNDNALQQVVVPIYTQFSTLTWILPSKHRRNSANHQKNYNCALCTRSFINQSALNNHTRDYHRRRYKPYHCALCNRSFGDQSALGNHTRDYHRRRNKRYASSNRSFSDQAALNNHIQLGGLHQDAKCPFCPSYFVSPSAVAHHIESGCHGITRNQVTHAVKTLDIVPNICISQRIEGASPTPPSTIKYYIASPRSFNGRAYACFLCQRMFRSLNSLSDHLNSAAHDANEFKCPKCKKRFKLISALIQHIESAACKLAGLQQIQNHFLDLIPRFSRLISF